MSSPSSAEQLVAEILVGVSPAVRRLRAIVVRVAPADIPVLIHGPTGAGKEVVARALHEASGRRGEFVAFNVCAIADSMFEDALFGHVRGAFTGASGATPGYIAEANGGTLFLDEIGTLSMHAQAKLLRALETRRFRAVGGQVDRHSNFRLVAATNSSLEALVRDGGFRVDLRYRLGAVVLAVPALAERPEDVSVLASHFLRLASPNAKRELSRDAHRELQAHDWPGNVRELRHVVEAVVALSVAERIEASEVNAILEGLHGSERASFVGTFFDRRMIEVLDQVNWRVSDAARLLGVARKTVYRRLQRLGLQTPRSPLSSGPNGRVTVTSCEGAPAAMDVGVRHSTGDGTA